MHKAPRTVQRRSRGRDEPVKVLCNLQHAKVFEKPKQVDKIRRRSSTIRHSKKPSDQKSLGKKEPLRKGDDQRVVENKTKQGKHSKTKTVRRRIWRTNWNRVRRGRQGVADGRDQRLEKVYSRRQSRNHKDRSTLFAKSSRSIRLQHLGAQAQTRWKIVGQGAKSLQTQETFEKLVKDTVAQDDDKVLIKNMQRP